MLPLLGGYTIKCQALEQAGGTQVKCQGTIMVRSKRKMSQKEKEVEKGSQDPLPRNGGAG